MWERLWTVNNYGYYITRFINMIFCIKLLYVLSSELCIGYFTNELFFPNGKITEITSTNIIYSNFITFLKRPFPYTYFQLNQVYCMGQVSLVIY